MSRQVAPCLAFLIVAASLTGCGVDPQRDGAPAGEVDLSSIPDAVPRVEPRSRYGNPESYVVHGKRYLTLSSARGFTERGIASWYGTKFHGRRTSSGEPYDMFQMTAAHRTLPLPTYVAVRNVATGHEVVVRVNDRGPFHADRILDLSYVAAAKLGIARKGTGLVEVRALDLGPTQAPTAEALPHAGSKKIYIQAGAFETPENASRMRARIAATTALQVRVRRTVYNGGAIHRVRIGPVSGMEEADRVVSALVALGIESPQVAVE